MSEDKQAISELKLEKTDKSLVGDFFRLVGGTVITQIIGIITVPVVSRFFGPEAYGISSLFLAVTSVLAVVACWRYELAIVIPEKDEDAVSVFFLSLITAITTTVIVSCFVAWGAEPIFELFKSESLVPYKWLVPVFVLLQGLYMSFNYWHMRKKRFSSVAMASIINSASVKMTNILTGFCGYVSGEAMINALIIGQGIASTTFAAEIAKKDGCFLRLNFNLKKIISSAKHYIKFPLISIWSAFLNTLSFNLPALLLTYYFSPVVAGYFAFGHRMLTYPLSLVGSAFSQVFFQRGAEASHNDDLNTITGKFFLQLIAFGLFPTLILMIISPELFSFVFGDKWHEAGIYAQILAPWVFFNFICSPITTVTEILNKQEIGLFFNVFLIITRFLSLYIGGVENNIYEALILYSITGAVVYIIWSLVLLRLAKALTIVFIKEIFKEAFVATVLSLPVLFVKEIFNNSFLSIGFAFIVFLIFSFIFFKRNNELLNVLKAKLRR